MITGQVSFAHAGFMSIGAFSSALLVMKANINFWLAWPLAGILAALVALLIGIPTLRLRGVYFFLVTFAFGEIIRILAKSVWKSTLGGSLGLVNIPPPNSIGFWQFRYDQVTGFYYLILLLTLMCLVFMYRIHNSRIGLIFTSIRECDFLAESIGADPMKYKVFAFLIGCFFAALGGGFYAHYFSNASSDSFSLHLGLNFLAACVVGGLASPIGPAIGAAFLTIITEIVRTFGPYEIITSGSILALTVLFFPEGLLGVFKRISLITLSLQRPETS
jgi:branched-chain amino acid transport system permease protein